jgi:DNA-binding NtrC family response regulator
MLAKILIVDGEKDMLDRYGRAGGGYRMKPEEMPVKILIVDDEKDMLVRLRGMLSDKIHCEITDTEDPFEVHGLLAEKEFDIVITDLNMPGLDGYQVLREVKQNAPDTRVIVMVSYTRADLVPKCLGAGAVDYLLKSFSTEMLLRAIERAMDLS